MNVWVFLLRCLIYWCQSLFIFKIINRLLNYSLIIYHVCTAHIYPAVSGCDSHLLATVTECVIFKICTNEWYCPSTRGYFRKKWCLQGSRSGNEMLINAQYSLDWMKMKTIIIIKNNKIPGPFTKERTLFSGCTCQGIYFRRQGEQKENCFITISVVSPGQAVHQCRATHLGLRAQHSALPAPTGCASETDLQTFFLRASIREVHWFYLNSF